MSSTGFGKTFFARPGGILLALAIAFLLVMLTFGATPIFWILQGRPNESYPELLFLGIGLPLGVVLVAAAGTNFWSKNRKRPARKPECH